jgi:hypothetical protein
LALCKIHRDKICTSASLPASSSLTSVFTEIRLGTELRMRRCEWFKEEAAAAAGEEDLRSHLLVIFTQY